MSVKPIIFSGPMVRALLDGEKTQTRRVLKPQPRNGFKPWLDESNGEWMQSGQGERGDDLLRAPYTPGDLLWVRERWGAIRNFDSLSPTEIGTRHFHGGRFHGSIGYPTDPISRWCQTGCGGAAGKWRPSIHMPRWASRLTLEVTDVRVQRVQEISEEDVAAEGMRADLPKPVTPGLPSMAPITWNNGQDFTAQAGFRRLWDSLNGPRGYGWDGNPWVAALTFNIHHCNVAILKAREER